jgi:DNA-binding response OmpR family regulator
MVPMAKRILLVSFDDRLLIEQRGRLEQQGYAVTSALRVKDATVDCKRDTFDLFIIGRSIPHSIKKDLIETFRAHSSRPILSLWTPGEQILDAVNYFEFSDNLDNFVKGVQTILTKEEASSAGQSFEA